MDNETKTGEGFKKILKEIGVDYSAVIVFGSRARKDFDELSDWDFLVILKQNLSLTEKKNLWRKIYKKFHEHFLFIPIDIILKDKEAFEKEKEIVNTISNEAYLEGIEI